MKPDALQFQNRDIAILHGLFESRIMTARHVAILYFDGKAEYTKKRLHQLKAAGLVGERKRRVNEPSVLFLTRKGVSVLQDHGKLDGFPALPASVLDGRARVSELTIRHELEVMDVKAAFHSAIRQTNQFSIAQFSTWPLLYQFQAARPGYGGAEVTVKPDGFIRIHEAETDGSVWEHPPLFLEVDRSTETQETLVSRAGCYRNYYTSGDFAIWRGGKRDDLKDYPFRVLIVCKTAERRNNTAERLLHSNPPILTQVCLTTFKEATSDPLGAVWINPSEYQQATQGTPFDTDRHGESWNFRRQPERERVVERAIRKFRLLAN